MRFDDSAIPPRDFHCQTGTGWNIMGIVNNGQKAVPKNQAIGEAGVQRTMLHAVTCRKTCQEMSEAYRLSFRSKLLRSSSAEDSHSSLQWHSKKRPQAWHVRKGHPCSWHILVCRLPKGPPSQFAYTHADTYDLHNINMCSLFCIHVYIYLFIYVYNIYICVCDCVYVCVCLCVHIMFARLHPIVKVPKYHTTKTSG